MNEVKMVSWTNLDTQTINGIVKVSLNKAINIDSLLNTVTSIFNGFQAKTLEKVQNYLKHISYGFMVVTTLDVLMELLENFQNIQISQVPSVRSNFNTLLLTGTLCDWLRVITEKSDENSSNDVVEILNKIQLLIEMEYSFLFLGFRKSMQPTKVFYLEEKK